MYYYLCYRLRFVAAAWWTDEGMGSFPTNTLKFEVGKRELCNNDALAASLGIVNSEFYFAGYMHGGFVNWRQNSLATIYLGQ